jgi:hypothetical protein
MSTAAETLPHTCYSAASTRWRSARRCPSDAAPIASGIRRSAVRPTPMPTRRVSARRMPTPRIARNNITVMSRRSLSEVQATLPAKDVQRFTMICGSLSQARRRNKRAVRLPAGLRRHFFSRLRAIGGLGTAPYLAASPRGLAGLPNENLACCAADVARGQIWPPTGGCKHENERLVCATIRRSGDSVIEGHKPYKMNCGLAHYGRGDRGCTFADEHRHHFRLKFLARAPLQGWGGG